MVIKNINTIFILILFVSHVHAQKNEDNKKKYFQYLESAMYHEVSKVINPIMGTTIGNFATLDLQKSEAKVSNSIMFNDFSIFNIDVNGGVTEEILPIFTEKKLNQKIGINLTYNFNVKLPSILVAYDTLEYVKSKKEEIKYAYELAKQKVNLNQDSFELAKKIIESKLVMNKLKIALQKLVLKTKEFNESRMKSVRQFKKKVNMNNDSLRLVELQIDSQYFADVVSPSLNKIDIQTKKIQIDSLTLIIQKYSTQLDSLPAKEKRLNEPLFKRNTELKDLEVMSLDGTVIKWTSLGVGLKNRAFLLFSKIQPLSNQISKDSYTVYSFNLSQNIIKQFGDFSKSSFFSYGISFSIEDNLEELSKVEINERENLGPEPDDRYLLSKFTAYSGEYKEDLSTWLLFGNWYKFLQESDTGALHLYFELKKKETFQLSSNLGIGYLIRSKSKDEKASLVNTEVYILFNDLLNKNKFDNNLFKRTEIGLQFSFPLNFKTKNYDKKIFQKAKN